MLLLKKSSSTGLMASYLLWNTGSGHVYSGSAFYFPANPGSTRVIEIGYLWLTLPLVLALDLSLVFPGRALVLIADPSATLLKRSTQWEMFKDLPQHCTPLSFLCYRSPCKCWVVPSTPSTACKYATQSQFLKPIQIGSQALASSYLVCMHVCKREWWSKKI